MSNLREDNTIMKRIGGLFLIPLFALACLVLGIPKADAGATVLFDQGHGQRFVIGEEGPLHLSGLAGLFREEGLTVTTLDAPLNKDSLASGNALVISGPFTSYTTAEVDSIAHFVENGGKVALMLHIGQPLADLLHRLGVDFSNSVLHEQENIIDNEPLNFRATRLEPHPVMRGLQHFSLYGAWALMNIGDNASIIARTSPNAWVDLNGDNKLSPGDAIQSFGVAVAGQLGKGEFIVFGDDAIFQNKFLDESNTRLARNLSAWLATH